MRLLETKDWQSECPYQVWHRAPTHPVALQQLVWEMTNRSVPTNRHTDSYWDWDPHSAATRKI